MKVSQILLTVSVILNFIILIGSVILNIILLEIVLNDQRIDTIAHATPHEEIILPPTNPDYDVVGIVPGIKKFVVKYNDKLLRGGLPYSEKGYDFLAEKKIKTVVSIVPDSNLKKWASKHGIKVIDLPFEKSKGLSAEQRKELINIYRTQSAPFYVHCHGGTHRASACAAVYRINFEDWTPEKAIREYDLLGGDPDKEKTLIDSIN